MQLLNTHPCDRVCMPNMNVCVCVCVSVPSVTVAGNYFVAVADWFLTLS